MTHTHPTRTRVTGCMADNWNTLNESQPALIINPDASALDLLAWCWGEAASMEATAQMLVGGESELTAGDLSALFLHRLSPLVNALHHATSDLLNTRRAHEGRA